MRAKILDELARVSKELFYRALPASPLDLTISYDTVGIIFSGNTYNHWLRRPRSGPGARMAARARVAATLTTDCYFSSPPPPSGTGNLTLDWVLQGRQEKAFQQKNYSAPALGDLLDYAFYLEKNYSRAWALATHYPELAAAPEHHVTLITLHYLAQDYRGCLALLATVRAEDFPAPAREFFQGQVYCKLHEPGRAVTLYNSLPVGENKFHRLIKHWLTLVALEDAGHAKAVHEYSEKLLATATALTPRPPQLKTRLKAYLCRKF